jgi:hypothetical protein
MWWMFPGFAQMFGGGGGLPPSPPGTPSQGTDLPEYTPASEGALPPAPNAPMAPPAPGDPAQPAAQPGQEHTIRIEVGQDMNQPLPPPPNGAAPGAPPAAGQPPMVPPYPQPNPSVPPSTGPNDPFQNAPPAPVPPATPAPEWQGNPNIPTGGMTIQAPRVGAAPRAPDAPGWEQAQFSEQNQYGGQDMFADPSQADYQSVQGYADQAYDQAMKRMEPQHAEQNRRLQQELINKGIDPNSAQGMQMADNLARQQADQMNSATFNALQFGQGIQNQMFGQEQAQADRAAAMQQALWGNQLGASGQGLQNRLGTMQNQLGWGQLQSQHALGQAGMQMQAQMANQANQLGWGQLGMQNQNMQNQYNLGRSGQDLQRYGMDLQNQLGQGQLGLGRQQQNFNEMLGLEGIDFRNWQANQQQQNWQDQFLYNMMMGTPAPGISPIQGGGQFTGTDPNIISSIGGFF